MSNFLSSFFEDRGYLNQCTDLPGLKEIFDEDKKITAYIGFDCTASSLHIGSLVQIMILRALQKFGHQAIVVLGDATTMVGDPSGKDKTRKMLDKDGIQANVEGIKKSISRFLIPSGHNSVYCKEMKEVIFVKNSEWLNSLNYIEFLREIGVHFSINNMLNFESVKLRLEREQHLSFLEFNYLLLQAYDFFELYKRYNCNVQIGGSDQWGNIVSGIDLARRKGVKGNLFALTTPLITSASGVKMGKTESGAIWLNPDECSDFDYYQYFRNVDDRDVGRWLRLFTSVDISEIEKLEKLSGKEINDAKEVLAKSALLLRCTGYESLLTIEELSKMSAIKVGEYIRNIPSCCLGDCLYLYSGIEAHKELKFITDIGELVKIKNEIIATLSKQLFDDDSTISFISNIDSTVGLIPEYFVKKSIIKDGVFFTKLFNSLGMVDSIGKVKRLISSGGVYINGDRISDVQQLVSINDFQDGIMNVSLGKKKQFILKLN